LMVKTTHNIYIFSKLKPCNIFVATRRKWE
jgi:hypothetical protein